MSTKKTKPRTNEQPALKEFRSDEQLSIDVTDKKILKVLNWDARLSYREIARQTKLSTNTVIERLKKLKTNEVMTGYSVNINPKKLGYGLTAIIELVAPQLLKQKTLNQIAELPNVYAVYHTTGDIDTVILTKFKSIDELRDFIENKLQALEIQRSETRIVFNTIKEDFRVLI